MSQHKKHTSKSKQNRAARPNRWWLGLALIIVVVAGFVVFRQMAISTDPTGAGSPLDVSPGVASAKREAGAFILDVREESEWNEFHIPGSPLIPVDTLANRLNELPRDKEIIVVCRSGNRSTRGRDILRSAGFTQVSSMTGGLTQWKAQGYPIVSGIS